MRMRLHCHRSRPASSADQSCTGLPPRETLPSHGLKGPDTTTCLCRHLSERGRGLNIPKRSNPACITQSFFMQRFAFMEKDCVMHACTQSFGIIKSLTHSV